MEWTFQLLKIVAPIILFCLILTTVDVFMDGVLIIKLFIGMPRCKRNIDFESITIYQYLASFNSSTLRDEYDKCQNDSQSYCKDISNIFHHTLCDPGTHPKFATMLMGKYIYVFFPQKS